MAAYPITTLQAAVLNNLANQAHVLRQSLDQVESEITRAKKELGLGLNLSYTNAAELDKRQAVFNMALNEAGVILDQSGMMTDDITKYVKLAITEDHSGNSTAGRRHFYGTAES